MRVFVIREDSPIFIKEVFKILPLWQITTWRRNFETRDMLDCRCYGQHSHIRAVVVLDITWDQALFSFRFENYIPAGKAKRKESLIQPFYETSAAHFLIYWHLPNQPTKITSVACFSSMQIFHAWEKCRLADLKNSFYLLILAVLTHSL